MRTIAGITVDVREKTVYREGEPLALTNKEYELLVMLMEHPDTILSREEILHDVWGYTFLGQSRTIDMHIQKLRRKLHWEDNIKTHYRMGYRFVS